MINLFVQGNLGEHLFLLSREACPAFKCLQYFLYLSRGYFEALCEDLMTKLPAGL